ncbi:neprosin family prolyl endopeptidase [Myxococcus qinghaiensis]|uniref:neprosin family prolyl endopeptidase n=1 Tax=Myxococcus qinghaiensis TaxID=2906758 RepID=UPI0020A7E47E|nr:neprosin family prolyl endopeptidase [Myxococcus qinghaiensis]MCP3165643.1 neprosin family prolyl endopeptidase [Myxococcus qinghaiensis]
MNPRSLFSPVACLFSLAAIGCGAPSPQEPAAPSDQTAEVAQYRCVPLSAEALRVKAPPTALVVGDSRREAQVTSVRLCPSGQVPQALHNPAPPRPLAAWLTATPGASADNRPVHASADSVYYAGVYKPTSETGYALGVGARLQIYNPQVAHSLDQVSTVVSMVRGASTSIVATGYRKFQTTYPTLLVGHTVGGVFQHVTGWVQVHPSYYPGMDLSGYIGAKPRFFVLYSGTDWWVYFNDAWVGYFPGSRWGGAFTSGEMAHWYGEVFVSGARLPPVTDMGNGLFPPNAASGAIEEMCTHNGTSCFLMGAAQSYVSNAAYYGLYYPGLSNLRYGGNGGG